METEPFDPSPYVRPPQMNLESGLALCRALVDACPSVMPASVKKAAKKLEDAAEKAQSALATRQKALGKISDEDVRLIDQSGDTSWSALRSRISAYANLPASEYGDATRAGELVIILFGTDGLSFLKESYPVQWATADTILRRIQEDNLQGDIDRIAGNEFLENIKKRHAVYGDMVKRLMTREDANAVDLSAELRALGRAIVSYATQVAAYADDDEPSSTARARAALRPLDLFREANARRASNATPNETTTTPTPEGPSTP